MNAPLVSITTALHTIIVESVTAYFRTRMKKNMTGCAETQTLTITVKCDK